MQFRERCGGSRRASLSRSGRRSNCTTSFWTRMPAESYSTGWTRTETAASTCARSAIAGGVGGRAVWGADACLLWRWGCGEATALPARRECRARSCPIAHGSIPAHRAHCSPASQFVDNVMGRWSSDITSLPAHARLRTLQRRSEGGQARFRRTAHACHRSRALVSRARRRPRGVSNTRARREP